MKIAKLFIIGGMATAFALGYSSSYAQENDGTVFFSGRVEASDRIKDCSGSCNADPSGTIEIGFSSDYSDEGSDVFIYRLSSSFGYSRYQFNINGNVSDVAEKGVYLHGDAALQSYPRFVLDAKIAPTWKTASSLNTPDRTVFGVGSGLDLLYQVEPGFYALIGWSSRTISLANQPDYRYSTVDLGLRWYLF